jgi:hypothetical protein
MLKLIDPPAVSELQFGNQPEDPQKRHVLFRFEFFPHCFIGSHPRLDQTFPVFAALLRQFPRWTPKTGHRWTPEKRPTEWLIQDID